MFMYNFHIVPMIEMTYCCWACHKGKNDLIMEMCPPSAVYKIGSLQLVWRLKLILCGLQLEKVV